MRIRDDRPSICPQPKSFRLWPGYACKCPFVSDARSKCNDMRSGLPPSREGRYAANARRFRQYTDKDLKCYCLSTGSTLTNTLSTRAQSHTMTCLQTCPRTRREAILLARPRGPARLSACRAEASPTELAVSKLASHRHGRMQ